jgi:leader peptidase (prepilin peptidase)/N-methyltransferase
VPTPLLVAYCAVVGLAVGSFLNVVIHRVPAGASVVRPRSSCPGCGTEIRPRDNIPVVSWILLRARCRDCGTHISARYPIVELLTAVLFAVLALKFGWEADLPAFLYLGAVGMALAAIDLDTRRLPDALTLPSYVVGFLLLAVAAAFQDEWGALGRAVLGMAALYAFYFVLMLAKSGGMGFGDVKLAGVLGLYLGWLGWDVLLVGAFLGFFLGAVVGVGLMVAGRAGRKSMLPFGPFMLAGALVAILSGAWLLDQYTSVFAGS